MPHPINFVSPASVPVAAREEHDKGAGVVITIGAVLVSSPVFGEWRAPDLATPDNHRGVQHAALLEVLDESGDRLVDCCLSAKAGLVTGIAEHLQVASLLALGARFRQQGGSNENFDQTWIPQDRDRRGPAHLQQPYGLRVQGK